MAEKKTTKAATATKTTAAKKPTAKKATTTKAATAKAAEAAIVYVNSENAGFRAGDIYQALAAAEAPMTVETLAKEAGVTKEDIYLGLGWLLKEGKIASTEDNKVVLA